MNDEKSDVPSRQAYRIGEPPTLGGILTDRQKTHGVFADVASVTQDTKEVWRQSRNWDKLSCHQREGLEMIAHKVARILSGDPNNKEHWIDGAGYFIRGFDGGK